MFEPGLKPPPLLPGIRLANPPDGGPKGVLDPGLKPALPLPKSRGAKLSASVICALLPGLNPVFSSPKG